MAKNLNGLTDSQVAENREKYGSNHIKEAPPETFFKKFLEKLNDPLIKLLALTALIMMGMWVLGQAKIFESIGTIVTILFVGYVGAKTEMASDKAYRNLKNSMPKALCKVKRNTKVSVIPQDDVVVGDVVILQSGDDIPADGYLVDGLLKVNNSALNGEPDECKKTVAPDDFELDAAKITGDTCVDQHSLFKGATVTSGEGLMSVKYCGHGNPETNYPGTMMGRMAEDMNGEEPDSPLKVKLKKLADQISMFGYIGAAIITVAYFIHFILLAGGISNYLALGGLHIFTDFVKAARLAIVIIVCAVPEGLPLMIAIVLMSNTGVLLKNNVLVRKAIGIETAGSLNTLFSDKTGTITKGILEVVQVIDGEGNVIDKEEENALGLHLDIAIGRNTSAMFDEKHNAVGGNMTDRALVLYQGENKFNLLKGDPRYNVTAQQGFNSANKFSSAYIESLGKTFYKGAPEKLLAKAKKYLAADGTVKDLDISVIDNKSLELANRAMRLLAFGYSEKGLVEDEINDDLVLIGIAAIRDDVRPEAKAAIAEVKGAGIHVCMITGDRKETAVAIAREANIIDSKDDIVLTSEELNKMSDEDIKKKFASIKCIARALPTDKSRMVRIGQSLNRVCGMTGDGVNDAPALKAADVGFSMGKSGTDAAKEASDLVIIDDNFASIRNAILYGRTIYLNILKFCRFQLAINVAAVVTSAILPFLGIEEALTVIQMLLVNLVMDSLGALLLGKECARASYMKHPPKRRDENIVTKNIFIQFVATGLYITALSIIWFTVPFFRSVFETDAQFKSAYFAFFIFAAIFNGFNVRTDKLEIFKDIDKNPNFMKIWSIMAVSTIVICSIDIIPGMSFLGEMFTTTHFGIMGWLLVIAYAVTIIPADMIRKVLCKTYLND